MGLHHSAIELQFVQAIDSNFSFKNRAKDLKTGPVERKAAVIADYLGLWIKVGIVTFVEAVDLGRVNILANA